MTGDQIQFFSLAAILLFATANSLLFRHKYGTTKGEGFWLWGMGFLALSCFSFGISPLAGRTALAIANLSLLLSYLSLSLQIRFWQRGKHNIPLGLVLFALAYPVMLETVRYLELPYIYRSSVVHGTMTLLVGYLFWSTLQLYRRNQSQPLNMVALTFLVEAGCAMTRTVIPFFQTNSQTVNWFTEESWMVYARWIWTTTNVITYLAIMMYQLEKTTDKKENLESLIAEKDQLLRATTMVSRANNASLLTGTIMHELRQPLSSILLGSTSLRKTLVRDDTQPSADALISRYADMIEKESMRSMAIMNRLEKVYAPERLTFQRVLLPELVENAMSLLDNRIQNNHIKIEKHYQSSGEIMGDALQIESVVTNLVSNAIKALDQATGPRIVKINVKEQNERIVLEVRDNGPGIEASVLQNIFSLFVSQGDGGIGIGLWLSRIIMENHHGEIHGKNMPGGGASFLISFPLPEKN